MKTLSLLLIAICLFGLDAKAQSLSEAEFREYISASLNQTYNVTHLPESFYQCAYDIYKVEGDAGEGFYMGYEVNRLCLPANLENIRFSDNGKKLWDEIVPVFINQCKVTNEPYSQVMNVNTYCNCMHDQYSEREIPLHVLIAPEFAESSEYTKISYYCLDESQN